MLKIALIALGILLAAAIVLLIYLAPYITYDREGAHLDLTAKTTGEPAPSAPTESPAPDDVTIIYDTPAQDEGEAVGTVGYYVTSAMLRDPAAVMEALQAMEEPCIVMLELKSIYGNFYYSTSIEGAQVADADIPAIDELISYLKRRGFYLIAEIPAFCDSAFALANQSSGLPIAGGALWVDGNGCYWLDPADDTVLNYLKQISRELSSLGFREVAFSDFRFPVGNTIDYASDRTTAQLISHAAQELTAFFDNSNLRISFVTDDTAFPANACAGKLYIPNADGSKVEKYVQAFSEAESISGFVFLTASRDTRFDAQSALRPLLAQ
jgi:hypothetical protein